MKILVSSHAFAPSIGGIETVTALLAEEFVRLGHEVMVVTQTVALEEATFPFGVLRMPSLGELRRALRWCDVYWQNNLSLRTLWPALLQRIPTVITHQGSYCRAPAGLDLGLRVKHFVAEQSTGVAISHAVAASLQAPSQVIPNPFDARLFSAGPPTETRPNELIFLGRLVSEKGLDVLLKAVARMEARLTIVGGGPERAAAGDLAAELGLGARVNFVGPKQGEELVGLLQQHKILVVPSRYDEPFGVVALEGIACGCVVVASSGGGLPEAVGPCGLTFPNGDVAALARLLEQLLDSPETCAQLRAAAPEHLAKFHPTTIAQQYLEVFQKQLR